MSARTSKTRKPTVFLSHSSKDRRELVALKRLLDERAAGMIEFFLSSDDFSIPHGTIWPAEVRAALDRMDLMLIFASPDALESPWTFFEAGYGLHKLNAAKIYCLPGTKKDALQSPFNLLQNKNLHSAKDITFLIQQINEALGSRMDESATKADFDKIFRKPILKNADLTPRLDEVVENVTVTTTGPFDSARLFSEACKALDYNVSVPSSRSSWSHEEFCSTGIRISIDLPEQEELNPEIKLSEEERQQGFIEVIDEGSYWRRPSPIDHWRLDPVTKKTASQTDAYNKGIRALNAPIIQNNEKLSHMPRACTFSLVPLEISVPTQILDAWLELVGKNAQPLEIRVKLLSTTAHETRSEFIGAKIQNSQLALLPDSNLLWRGNVIVKLPEERYAGQHLILKPQSNASSLCSDFHLDDLIEALCEHQILMPEAKKETRRKR